MIQSLFLQNPNSAKVRSLLEITHLKKQRQDGDKVDFIPFLFSAVKQWEHSSHGCGWAILSVFGAIKATCLKCNPFKCQI